MTDKKEAKKIGPKYEELKAQLAKNIHQLSSLKPIVAFSENQLYAMELWTTHHAEDSPMAKLSIKGKCLGDYYGF